MLILVRAMAVFSAVIATIAAPDRAVAESTTLKPPALVQIKAGAFQYRPAGEFTHVGKPVDAPLRTVQISAPVSIMTHQVSVDEYARCVTDNACSPLVYEQSEAAVPVVMVSWNDARAYAAWLSKKLGQHYRLPTDEEWFYAAGSRAPAESPLVGGSTVARWLARYDRESQEQPVDAQPQPIGHFGANENGLSDIAGNVWEWTDTCYTRTALDTDGNATGRATINCGVRVAEGPHRANVVDYIRDARAGGCAAGIPPSNLGFRLVLESNHAWAWF
jgi:formylglycine-generating enzyme required for sulfatase activity